MKIRAEELVRSVSKLTVLNQQLRHLNKEIYLQFKHQNKLNRLDKRSVIHKFQDISIRVFREIQTRHKILWQIVRIYFKDYRYEEVP